MLQALHQFIRTDPDGASFVFGRDAPCHAAFLCVPSVRSRVSSAAGISRREPIRIVLILLSFTLRQIVAVLTPVTRATSGTE